ncbi:ATP-binding protein [Variovorax sp. J22G73]|uniref:sensor histidine kinase n=1 Tax=unclassified Variovorax TaxID=663243 RepID=UPI000D5D2DDA|nr:MULTISPECIES: ATP-binding protein [unclassified Variovorax]MDM0006707.1 ATP-binding protein [Variovorax sp. J22R203]MDM0097269.1 ATP-binding protein [Variovorax sp. J22G73]
MLSFRKRLALAHVSAIVVVMAIAAFASYLVFARNVHRELDAALLALAETEMGMLLSAGEGDTVIVHEAPPGPGAPSFVRLDRLVQIVDAEGRVLARSANLGEAQLPIPPVLRERLAAGETVFETLNGFGEEPTRMVSVPVRGRDNEKGQAPLLAVQVAGSLDDVNRTVAMASVLFVILGGALLLALGAAGALITRRAFGAIDDVVQQAHRIGDANLGERLPHPGTNDEIGRLVDTLNAMLARIEHGMEAQRRFTSDASHELRSPLSRLRTELELALRRPREPTAYVETLHSSLEEVESLTLLVEELLVLARLDAGQERDAVETVSLNVLAEEAVRRLEPMARERRLELLLEPAAPVAARVARGAASLALANLLDNALKFSPAGTTVRVSLRADAQANEAVVSVADRGPGIRGDELPHLFERFYRGATARSDEKTPGLGLGLALSQAVVHAHGGRIEAANESGGGARFDMRLPLAR